MPLTEWTSIIPSADSLPQGVTAHDLFGGELFGDELMDMYNSAEVVGHEIIESEIPSLLGGATESGVTTGAKVQADAIHPGTQVAIAANAIDDGFGAFRPSTSFNDLTSLLPPETSSGVTANGAVAPDVTASGQVQKATAKKQGKKRAAAGATDGQAKKKGGPRGRAPAGTTGRRASTKGGKATAARTTVAKAPNPPSAGQVALKLRTVQRALLSARTPNGTNETPDPLDGCVEQTVTPPTKTSNNIKRVPAPWLPVAFTPKTGGNGKGDSIMSEAAAAHATAAAAAIAAAALPTTKPAPNGIPIEADFKSVAQAAVTNLILNAGSQKVEPKGRGDPGVFTGKVNTSTEHIKALTSSNWVNACGGGSDTESASNCSLAADSKANNRARRQNLTPEERARQNRDRNREHARNTRLRKKAYVDELKRVLAELVAQRDAADLEKRHTIQRETEQREVRFRVMEEFLKLRGRNEPTFSRWVAILEDNFSLKLPKMAYMRTGQDKDDWSMAQVLKGATEVMTDASYIASVLSTLKKDAKAPVRLQYNCERKNFFMDGSVAMLDWAAEVVGGDCKAQLAFQGVMRAKFSPASNKLISAELVFDTGSLASQLAAATAQALSSSDKCDEIAAAAAQAAAHEADALLDSLQMPSVPSAITVMPFGRESKCAEAFSVTCSEKEEDASSDESMTDIPEHLPTVSARRSARLSE